jgi:hypothetical protein
MSWTVIVQASVVIAAAAAAGLLLGWSPRGQARRALKTMKESRLADVKDGERARVTGVVAALDRTLTSPISGRSCVGFHVRVEQVNAVGIDWHTVIVQSDVIPFKVIDGGIEARVEGPVFLMLDTDDRGDLWANLPPSVFELLERNHIAIQGPFTKKELRFEEALLVPGDRVIVGARVTVDPSPDGAREGHRAVPLRYTFRGEERAPVVVADADDPPP